MIALYTFIPLYCPSCGTPTRLDRIDNALSGKYQAHQSQQCSICGVMFQLATKTDLLRAATASGGDLVEYFIEDDNEVEDNGKLN
jgi:transposase-like protein